MRTTDPLLEYTRRWNLGHKALQSDESTLQDLCAAYQRYDIKLDPEARHELLALNEELCGLVQKDGSVVARDWSRYNAASSDTKRELHIRFEGRLRSYLQDVERFHMRVEKVSWTFDATGDCSLTTLPAACGLVSCAHEIQTCTSDADP